MKFAAVLGRPAWPTDARFATNRARLQNRAALVAEMDEVLKTRGRLEWAAALEAAGVPCAPINSLAGALEQPQVKAIGMLQSVPDTDFTLTALPVSFDGVRPQIRSAAPPVG